MIYLNSFYTDKAESGNPCTKWAPLTINEMECVYNSIDITKILDREYDSRKCRIEKLHVRQLRKECETHGINVPGGSKKEIYVSELQKVLGEHAMVNMI